MPVSVKGNLHEGIARQYLGLFRPEVGARKVGIELEFPMVYSDKGSQMFGQTIGAESTKGLLRAIAAGDQRWSYDESHVLLEKDVDGFKVFIGTDTCIGTLEIGFPPYVSLKDSAASIRQILNEVLDSADRLGIALLGYGMHPFTPPSKAQLSPKDRFLIFEMIMGPNFNYQKMGAANQVHVDVSVQDLAMVQNTLNAFSPALIAAAANSAIMEGRHSGYEDFRNIVWHMMTLFSERHGGRVGIAPRVGSAEDHLESLLSFPPLLVERDGRYFMLEERDVSMAEYISRGSIAVIDPKTKDRIEIEPRVEDVHLLEGTCWWQCRAKACYSTAEWRSAALQRDVPSMVSIGALAKGLVSSLPESMERISAYDHVDVVRANLAAIKNGFGARLAGEPIVELARDMVSIAHSGLARVGEDTSYLDPLMERVYSGTTQSQISVAVLYDRGPEGLIDYLRLRRS